MSGFFHFCLPEISQKRTGASGGSVDRAPDSRGKNLWFITSLDHLVVGSGLIQQALSEGPILLLPHSRKSEFAFKELKYSHVVFKQKS